MTKVRITSSASDFNPDHAVAVVSDSGHLVGADFFVETGPSTTGVEFGLPGVQWGITDFAVIGPRTAFIV